MDVLTLALAKAYTDQAVEGAGGTAGKNCQIKSITEITGGHRVTFAWYDDDQVIREDTMDVMDGVDGQDGADGDDGAPGVGVPSGGTTGQVLKKKSGTDYDTEWGNAGGGSGGHTIKNDGVAMTARSGLDFVDFDMTDDSEGDETVASSHLLTSSELNDIFSTLPGKKTDLPVLFDERGTEYQVGWYVLANGTKKPVYEKTVDCGVLTFTSNVKNVVHNISNIDTVCDIKAIGKKADASILLPVINNFSSEDAVGKILVDNTNVTFKGWDNWGSYNAYVTIRYTKTTDTPV